MRAHAFISFVYHEYSIFSFKHGKITASMSHTHTHPHSHTHTHTHTHTHRHTQSHTNTLTRPCLHFHTEKYTHTHTYTHIYAHKVYFYTRILKIDTKRFAKLKLLKINLMYTSNEMVQNGISHRKTTHILYLKKFHKFNHF